MSAYAVLQGTVLTGTSSVSVDAGATIRVDIEGGAIASLFSDTAMSVAVSNPYSVDSSGFYRVYLAPGEYKVTINGTSGTKILRHVKLVAEIFVTPEMFGTINGSTDSAAIQAADDYAAANDMAVHFFAREYGIDASISKSLRTIWRGAGMGREQSGFVTDGTTLKPTVNGVSMISITGPGSANYSNGQVRDMRLLGDLSTYTTAIGISLSGGARQHDFINLHVKGFNSGIKGVGGGEFHFYNVFASGSHYDFLMSGVADSTAILCTMGSGAAYSGGVGYGVKLQSSGSNPCSNWTFAECRLQMSNLSGLHASHIRNLRICNCHVDQNTSHGITLAPSASGEYCKGVIIDSVTAYDNGATTAKRAAIYLSADNGESIEATISGLTAIDQQKGLSGERQDRGVGWATTGTGTINLSITGGDLRNVTTPLKRAGGSGAVVHVDAVSGLVGQFQTLTEIGDSDHTVDVDDGDTISYTATLTADRSVDLPTGDLVYSGTKIIVARTLSSDGDFILAVKYGSTTIADLSAPGTQIVAQYDGAAWDVIEAVQTQYATSTDIGDKTKYLNVRLKRRGTEVYNTTDDKKYYATGSATTSPWRPNDGGTDITPT